MKSVLNVCTKTNRDSLINSNVKYILKISARTDAKAIKHHFFKYVKIVNIL
jgi:hypothetical protein